MRFLFTLTFILIFFSCFFSCEEKDDFSSNPDLRLAFSSDTISFDTVFTNIGSSRQTLKVYNNNDKSLIVSSVKVMNSEKTGFSIAVDGVSGNEVIDTEILKKDSAYVFIMVKVDPLNSDNPLIIRDSIRFVINGQTQYVQLEAVGQDVHVWRGKTIEQDTILTGEKPFLVYDSLVIAPNVTLNLRKNVQMFFHAGAGVKLRGTINAKGTKDEPVVFRGDRTDRIFTDVPYDRIPGQWEGMIVDSLSFNNHFEYFHLRNSVYGIYFKQSNTLTQKAYFLNSIIHNTTSDGIYAHNCDIKGDNSLFSNSGGSVMRLIGGKYEFLHCTLANYISWWGMRKDVALTIANITSDNNAAPLAKCNFTNSIIAGLSSSEIKLKKAENTSIPFNHLFTNCLIKVGGEDDENFVETIWKEDPKFKNINNDSNYFYSYELDSLSPARNKANYIKAMSLPNDMLGRSRFQDEGPDIGCYEWVS